MLNWQEISERHEVVQARMAAAAARAGRPADDVTLIAVTKTWPAQLVIEAYDAGLFHFGENRPEELAAKRPLVEAAVGPHVGLTWHLIGTLQSRKTDLAAAHADVFHALDRDKIARRLATDLARLGRTLPTFVEVNLSGEATKSGLMLTNWEQDATQRAALRTMINTLLTTPHLPPLGLMTMAPWDAPPDEIRAVFRRCRALAEWLAAELPGLPRVALSMGMTDDFEIAIEEGATHIRVGRALFGERGVVN
jgi:pyridoxal phosphate enzyme (YggS family)